MLNVYIWDKDKDVMALVSFSSLLYTKMKNYNKISLDCVVNVIFIYLYLAICVYVMNEMKPILIFQH